MIETPETNKPTPRSDPEAKAPDSAEPNSLPATDDDLDFVVTEAHDQATELVGGFQSTKEDALGIESPADIMEAEASHDVGDRYSVPSADITPIGDTSPPPPPSADKPLDADLIRSETRAGAESFVPANRSGLQKLSDERLEEISRQMKGESTADAYLSSEEKHQLLQTMDKAPVEDPPTSDRPKTGFDNQPIVPPSKQKSATEAISRETISDSVPSDGKPEIDPPQPRMSGRVRGVAHFARGYIKISGEQELREGDTLEINDREYQLRHKQLSSKLVISVVAPLAAILIFVVGAMFSSDADTGVGQVVGLLLDDYNQPFISGTEVRFPELGKSYQSNGQGFFKSDDLDAGTYKIEFVYEGQVVATDYTTVVSDQITTLTLRPEPIVEAPPAPAAPKPEPVAQAAPAEPQPTAQATPPRPARSSPKETAPAATSSGTSWAKLALEANVDGAKLTVDGNVMGAGNLTYPRLKPGLHEYAVSKNGYQTYRGSVDLTAGQTKVLNISLTASPAQVQTESPVQPGPLEQGQEYLAQNQTNAAIASFTQAVQQSPSQSEAYLGRAQAYEQNRDTKEAHDDYLRAAEISTFKRDFNGARAAFDKALAIDSKSIPAYLGRGNMYLSRSEEIAAVADFDMAVRLDKRNVNAHIGLGQARYNQGYFEKATKHFKDARSIDDENPAIHRSLMMCYYREGDFKQVKKSYEKFVKYASDNEQRQLRANPEFAPVLRVIGE